MITNEEKANEIAIENSNIWDDIDLGKISTEGDCYESAMEMAKFKDEQPISELGGWHTEPPTEDGLYLADKGYADEDAFRYIVVWWSCSQKLFSLTRKMFYQEIKRWKRI